ncbi:MAG: thioredoxin domain-containing protein [Verrucomicrobiota bacterium]|nr:thioredoxin domain-containing protein [Verrucomicrobiota bacterium]
MRLAFTLFLAAASFALAAALPLTVKDVSLMLRSGYSIPAVEKELASRRFADTLDEAKTKQLQQAGASPALIEALVQGKYSVPPDQLEESKRKLQEESAQRELAAAKAAQTEKAYQQRVAQSRAQNIPMPTDVIAQLLRGNLVRCANGSFTGYFDEELNRKKIYALYFSAHWCPPCRKFTPQLVAFYDAAVRDHPEFEVILVSADKSADAMRQEMADAGMNWPAIEYSKVASMTAIKKYAGEGIPDLVIVDAAGRVVADSYMKGQYIGPVPVLAALNKFFHDGSPQVATTNP